MDAILKFVGEHQLLPGVLLFLFFVFALLALAIQRVRADRRTGISFPLTADHEVLYDEATASGRSLKSLLTRLGGAAQCLKVTVTRDEVRVRPTSHGVIPMPELDLVHRVKKSAVTATRIGGLGRSGKVRLEYRRVAGEAHSLELVLRDAEGFLAALAQR